MIAILTMIIGIVFVAMLVPVVRYRLGGGRDTATLPPKRKLSHASKQLLKEYKSLPEESQNIDDFESVLFAMDVQAGEDDHHFDANWLPLIQSQLSGGYDFKWNPGHYCNHHHCGWSQHVRLHRRLDEIAASIKEKEKTLALSKVQPDLDRVAEIESRLRDEVTINNEFVRTWKELG